MSCTRWVKNSMRKSNTDGQWQFAMQIHHLDERGSEQKYYKKKSCAGPIENISVEKSGKKKTKQRTKLPDSNIELLLL